MTAKQAILERLKTAPEPLSVHELAIAGYSENNLATRLSEMAKAGLVVGIRRPGKAFKEWSLAPQEALGCPPSISMPQGDTDHVPAVPGASQAVL